MCIHIIVVYNFHFNFSLMSEFIVDGNEYKFKAVISNHAVHTCMSRGTFRHYRVTSPDMHACMQIIMNLKWDITIRNVQKKLCLCKLRSN